MYYFSLHNLRRLQCLYFEYLEGLYSVFTFLMRNNKCHLQFILLAVAPVKSFLKALHLFLKSSVRFMFLTYCVGYVLILSRKKNENGGRKVFLKIELNYQHFCGIA